jgi:hypothetical protein
LAHPVWAIRYLFLEPSDDHELEIAREVDRLARRNQLFSDAVPELRALLDFKISSTDYDFLKRYIYWRIENPVVK